MRWPYLEEGKRAWQHEAVELKVWRDKGSDPLPAGLVQLEGYLERLAQPQRTLVIFDRRTGGRSLSQRVRFLSRKTASGRPVTILRA